MAGTGVAITSGDAIPLLDDNGSGVYVKGRNSALDIRKGLLGSLFLAGSDGVTPRPGVLMGAGGTSAFRVDPQASPNQTVLVRKGAAILPRTGQGAYLVYMDVDQTVNMPAASGANTRYDVVCLASFDLGNFVGDVAHGPQIWIESGTLGGGVPATPTGMIKLAEVFRAVNDNVLNAEIVNKRNSTALHTLAPRGLGEGDSLVDPGFLVGETRDVAGRIDRWNGTAWQQLANIGTARGYLGADKPVVAKSSVGTTETVACVVQVTLEAGRRIQAHWRGALSSTGTTTNGEYKLRGKQTASLTDVTGTIMGGSDIGVNAAGNNPGSCFGEFLTAVAGVHTFVLTLRSGNGNGNVVQAFSATNIPELMIMDIGV
jgi:hypothetical protein